MAMQLQVLGHKLDVTKTRNGERGAGKRKIGTKQRTRLRVVLHFSSGILERAKRERA